MTHPHKDIIIALLDDPTLEVGACGNGDGSWEHLKWNVQMLISHISASQGHQFRLREKPKPDVGRYGRVRMDYLNDQPQHDDNARFIFSADGVLKNAEVIK